MEKMESDRAMTINARCRLGLLQATQGCDCTSLHGKECSLGQKGERGGKGGRKGKENQDSTAVRAEGLVNGQCACRVYTQPCSTHTPHSAHMVTHACNLSSQEVQTERASLGLEKREGGREGGEVDNLEHTFSLWRHPRLQKHGSAPGNGLLLACRQCGPAMLS